MGGKGRHVSTLESRGLEGCHAFRAPQTGAAGSLCLSEGLRGGAVRQAVRGPHFSRRFWPLPEWWWVEYVGGGRLDSGQGLDGGGRGGDIEGIGVFLQG